MATRVWTSSFFGQEVELAQEPPRTVDGDGASVAAGREPRDLLVAQPGERSVDVRCLGLGGALGRHGTDAAEQPGPRPDAIA
jgi:hypothetical protein